MRRGVFAIGWFFLLASALTAVYSMKALVLSEQTRNDGLLMDAEEAFYTARNFEADFRKTMVSGEFERFRNYWSGRGRLIYGHFQDYPEKACVQTSRSFQDFVEKNVQERGDIVVFSPDEEGQTCVVLEVDYKEFKTYGIIKSLICASRSSFLQSC
jgi:hypothetical protein